MASSVPIPTTTYLQPGGTPIHFRRPIDQYDFKESTPFSAGGWTQELAKQGENWTQEKFDKEVDKNDQNEKSVEGAYTVPWQPNTNAHKSKESFYKSCKPTLRPPDESQSAAVGGSSSSTQWPWAKSDKKEEESWARQKGRQDSWYPSEWKGQDWKKPRR